MLVLVNEELMIYKFDLFFNYFNFFVDDLKFVRYSF